MKPTNTREISLKLQQERGREAMAAKTERLRELRKLQQERGREAMAAKTERLRELRLAKEAADREVTGPAPKRKPKVKRRRVRSF